MFLVFTRTIITNYKPLYIVQDGVTIWIRSDVFILLWHPVRNHVLPETSTPSVPFSQTIYHLPLLGGFLHVSIKVHQPSVTDLPSVWGWCMEAPAELVTVISRHSSQYIGTPTSPLSFDKDKTTGLRIVKIINFIISQCQPTIIQCEINLNNKR